MLELYEDEEEEGTVRGTLPVDRPANGFGYCERALAEQSWAAFAARETPWRRSVLEAGIG